MTVEISQSVARRVAEHFEPRRFQRGLMYARDGRVGLVRSQWPVVAQVRVNEGYVVTVYYTPETEHVRGECSCAARADCEHVIAAALVAMADAGEASEARNAARKQEAVGAWLSTFVPEPGGRPSAGGRYVVAYVIARIGDALGLTVQKCAALKRGGFGRGALMASLGDPSRGAPPWVEVEDLRRIALLRAITRAAPLETVLRLDRVDGALLRDLADSGHLFWDSVDNRPLCVGPERRCALRWRESHASPGEHYVGVEDELILVPAQQCHYIDPANATIGPLDVDAPANVVQQLVRAPPIPTSMMSTVARSLRPLLGPAARSALSPPDRPEDDDAAPPPRPHAIAHLEEDDIGSYVEVEAEAVYGTARFPLAQWDADRPAPRDMVAEGHLRRRLDRLVGSAPLSESDEPLAQARHVAHRVLPALAAEGWTYELAGDFPFDPPATPDDWVETLKPLSDSRGWFSVDLGVVIAGRTVSLLPILLGAIRDGELPVDTHLLDAESLPGINLRLPDGELVHVPGDRLRRWLRPLVELELRGLAADGALLVPDFTAAEIAEHDAPRESGRGLRFAGADVLAQIRARAAALLSLPSRREPASFSGALRPYQRQGLAWLRALHDAGHGGLLADEMGLGKTVQVLAFLEDLRSEGGVTREAPALVVAPRSVVGHWRSEAGRFASGLEPLVHLGPGRARRAAELQSAPLVITTYQTLHRDRKLLSQLTWTTVVFDEAQALKNSDTHHRRTAASLAASSRFAITGTPIENQLRELWSQVDLVMPGLLGTRPTFDAVFRRPIEKYAREDALEFLRRRIRPFLLRRRKRDVDIELPDRTEIIELIDLDSDQRDLYESLRLSLDDRVRQALRDQNVQGSSLVVLDALLKLRQCCCDPRLVKMAEAQKVRDSAKLERLMSMLDELADSGRSVLVFSQFTSMLKLIEGACRAAGIDYLKLTGNTRKRDEVVRAFQSGEAPVFLISLKAGGTGLNLTRADTVIHYDPWWNPAVEDQASDRAHRIGQDRHVFIYKLVARGTLEERILELQREKRTLTAATLERGGASHLAPDDLASLYRQLV